MKEIHYNIDMSTSDSIIACLWIPPTVIINGPLQHLVMSYQRSVCTRVSQPFAAVRTRPLKYFEMASSGRLGASAAVPVAAIFF